MHIGVFYFRRDLRIHDNSALHKLCTICDVIVPIFCFDPRQVNVKKNAYYSNLSVRFMLESLQDLDRYITKNTKKASLNLFYGLPEKSIFYIVETLFKHHKATHVTVGWNEDNTPFALSRDQKIKKYLQKKYKPEQLSVHTNSHDVTIVPVRDIRTNGGAKYQQFKQFYKKALAKGVKFPKKLPTTVFLSPSVWSSKLEVLSVSSLWKHKLFKHLVNTHACVAGGRTEALKRLTTQYIQSRCSNYNIERNYTWEEKTTRLSAYFKFGCISFREAYHAVIKALNNNHVACEALTREFFWNAFYSYVSYCFPYVLAGQLNGFTKTKKKRINLEMQVKLQNTMNTFWKENTAKHLQRLPSLILE